MAPEERRGRRAAARAFLAEWVRLNWGDCVGMAALGGVAFGIYHSDVPVTRTFPISFDGSGDVVYPEWAYPYRGWIIPSWASGVVSIAGPIVVYVAAQVRIGSAWDASCAVMGSVWAVLLASLFQVVVKQLIGGFRPYFLDVCMPDVARAPNRTGLDASGFHRLMFTTDVCTQPDAMKLKTAITSFPSGHSTATCAGFGFLFLWMNAKLKVWADHRPAFWKLALTLLPVLLSVVIACSLTIDAAHNWYDILAGALIGVTMAFASYRASYAAVWDWRFNHVPLRQAEAFSYRLTDDHATQTFTRSAGWGQPRDWLPRQLDSAATSAVFAHGRADEARGPAAEGAATDGQGRARPKRQAPADEEEGPV